MVYSFIHTFHWVLTYVVRRIRKGNAQLKDTLKYWEIEVMEALLLDQGDGRGQCEHCKEQGVLIHCGSRRMDTDDSCYLCPACTTEFHEYWDEMWETYWSGQL